MNDLPVIAPLNEFGVYVDGFAWLSGQYVHDVAEPTKDDIVEDEQRRHAIRSAGGRARASLAARINGRSVRAARTSGSTGRTSRRRGTGRRSCATGSSARRCSSS